ncbi:MAG: GDSL-type esterase/lipase family protein [Xanthobacteraceae bacterium]
MLKRALSTSTLLFAAALLLAVAANATGAAALQIVALGASNTEGYGVGSDAAWPARLQAMLRARGYQATVANAGISGDTTAGMLSRLDSAVPGGTQIVVYAIYDYNDTRKGISPAEHAANVQKILALLHARHIKTIAAAQYFSGLPRQSDGIHLTAEGHAAFAARVLPQVIAAAGHR